MNRFEVERDKVGRKLITSVMSVSFVLCYFLLATSFHKKIAPSKPNIIVILIDDAGYADFGFMGSNDLLTPNLDQLAAHSIRFTNAYVTASVCSPSRAGLLTGKYQQRFGYECNEGEGYTGMDSSQTVMAAALKSSDYQTAAFGKWHLGFQPSQHPLQKGFDYYYGFLSGSRSYFYRPAKDDRPGEKNAVVENDQQVKFDGYLTDVLGDKAVDYIRKSKEHPFFMYWAPNAVHTPLEATDTDMQRFAHHPRQKLAAMTYALDRSIGRIMSELKKQGLYENTLIFFLSDNGGAHNNQSSNAPLKGFKGNKYEGGLKVPFLLSWPARFAGNVDYNGITSSMDIFATALDAAGLPSKASLDGVSLLPFLAHENMNSPHEQLVWRKDAEAAIRYRQYKLIRVQGLGNRLYDMEKDPGETNDLSIQQPGEFASLNQKLRLWEKDKMSPLWKEGPIWDTITLMIHDDLMNNRKVRVTSPSELEKLHVRIRPIDEQKIRHVKR